MIRAIHHVQLAMLAGREAEADAFYAGLLGMPRVPMRENPFGNRIEVLEPAR
ncbi:MAG TPA: hypothetical protein VLS28_02965 [Candidatus Sulfomarinibacteraceae bacterium]|nr:hypothetical protein [Candidatus Sulfomarinibacteraceae bacterium]